MFLLFSVKAMEKAYNSTVILKHLEDNFLIKSELMDTEEDKKITEKIVDEFSRGYPRQGLKGKYIKVKGKLPGQRWPSKNKKMVAGRTEEEQGEYDRLKSLKKKY